MTLDIFVTQWVRSSIATFDPLVAVIPATIAAIHGTIRDNRSYLLSKRSETVRAIA